MADNINQYGQSLRGAFAQLLGQSPQTTAPAAPSTAPQVAAPAAQNWSGLLNAGGNDAYKKMLAQVGDIDKIFAPQKPYTPPAPPVPISSPPPSSAPVVTADYGGTGSWGDSAGGGNAGVGGPGAAGAAGDAAAAAAAGTGDGFKRGGLVLPTEAQKHAGNYKKHHISFHGLPVSIETPKGATREGKDPNGKAWRCTMPADYGYIKRTEGADGDHVDVFVGPDRDSRMVFIINQNDHRTGHFDEHKAMLAYSSERAAVADYVKAFSDGKGHDRIRSVEPMSLEAFKHWLKRGKTKSPAKSKSIIEHALAVIRSKK